MAHIMDLLLEDIAKLSWVVKTGREVVKFIKNHQASLAIYRSHSKKELVMHGEPHWAQLYDLCYVLCAQQQLTLRSLCSVL